MRRWIAAFIAAIFLFGATTAAPRRADATSVPLTGAQWTQIIVGGGILVFLGIRYGVDVGHAAGATKEAQDFFATPIPVKGTTQTLMAEREKIIAVSNRYASTISGSDTNRSHYEDLRVCWNSAVVDPSPTPSPTDSTGGSTKTSTTDPTKQTGGSGGSKKKPGSNSALLAKFPGQPADVQPATVTPASGGGTGSAGAPQAHPTPAPTPAPGSGGGTDVTPDKQTGCDAVLSDIEGSGTKPNIRPVQLSDVDLTDVGTALKIPSLVAQIQIERVGSYKVNNKIRAQFLIDAGDWFVQSISPPGRFSLLDNPSATDYTTAIKDCGTAFSAFDCFSDAQKLETAAAQAQATRFACAFSSKAFMPEFTQVKDLSDTQLAPQPDPAQPDTWKPYLQPQQTTYDQAYANFLDRIGGADFGAGPGC